MGKFDIVYVSSACNRTPHSADWGRNGLICYAASNSIALYDPEFGGAGKVISVLCQHKDRVNSVRWIKRQGGLPETELVSASTDNTAIIWSKTDEQNFSVTSILKDHQSIVTIADGIYISDRTASTNEDLIVATASVDSSVKIWRRFKNEEGATCIQTLKFGSGFCLCLSFAYLPGTDVILLACAADDAKIHLFAEHISDSCGNEFQKVNTLVGHEDWVRAMDFAFDSSGDLLLASSSQDALIRLWRIAPRDKEVATRIRKKISELDISEDIQPEEKFFSIKTISNGSVTLLHFAVLLESVLTGHEGWVYGVSWHPPVYSSEEKKFVQPMKLLSSSLDKTIIIWEPDEASGVWLESVRVGEVGGNTLGFYGSKFGPDGLRIMGHGYQGSFHMWSYSKNSGIWEPDVTTGGHFGEVVDMQWEPGGQFLVSVSTDQTTRLHAPWIRDGQKEVTWHELARPQVHGFDMSCIAMLSRYRFASGAEEKVIRAFQAPNNFVNNFHQICKIEPDKDIDKDNVITAPQGASVPALGLSNKAVYEGQEMAAEERHVKDEYPEFYFTPIDLKEPPTEENLIQNTLWPEVHKLYGHGYELFALAARHDGSILASACKATITEHAAIILWDTSTWKQVQTLTSHNLTVTQMSFSPDDRFLLSVSRDRRWSLFQLEDGDTGGRKYMLIATTDKKTGVHSRIIWCCCWTHDSKYFLTGSRDGKVVAWSHSGLKQETTTPLGPCSVCSKPLELPNQSVTALAAAPVSLDYETYLVAVGLENGQVILYKWSPLNEEMWQKCLQLDAEYAHHLTVKRIAFRPIVNNTPGKLDALDLASCGSDHAVKIIRINLNKL